MTNIKKDTIHIGNNISGNEINITKFIMDSETPGKKIYIQSGMHGGEITHWIQHKLFNILKDKFKKGKITFVPICNPIAWEQKIYFSTVGKFDFYNGQDFNRNFPGAENQSLPQKIAYNLFKLAKEHDFVIDLHTSQNSIPFVIFNNKKYQKYVDLINIEYNYLLEKEDTAFDFALTKENIDNVVIECGSHDSYQEDYINEVVDGILNILSEFNMIENDIAKNNKELKTFKKQKKLYVDKSCFILYNKTAGEKFKKGDVLYTKHLTDTLGQEEEYLATENGIVLKTTPTHTFRTGDNVLTYISKDDIF
jgi:predicted deacylase